MKYQLLLKPLIIDNLTFPNRIVMPPMATYSAMANGFVTSAHIEHYRNSIGPGLMIVEGTAVLPEGRTGTNQLGIYSDQHIEGLAKLAEIIKNSGGVAGIQLHHAGATAFMEAIDRTPYHYAKILARLLFQQVIPAFNLKRIRDAFRKGARRAVEAGYDIIEIHAAHGYLFNQLLSPRKNWRLDRYNGNLNNRRRFLEEVFSAVKEAVAGRATVTCRLGIADRHDRGFSLSEGIETASLLIKKGMKILDVSNGNGIPDYIRPENSQYSARLHLAREAKAVLPVPIIGGGNIRHPDDAEQALRDNMADMVYVGRALLADPAWARKTIDGRADDISLCLQCNTCFHFTDPTKCPARRKKQA